MEVSEVFNTLYNIAWRLVDCARQFRVYKGLRLKQCLGELENYEKKKTRFGTKMAYLYHGLNKHLNWPDTHMGIW